MDLVHLSIGQAFSIAIQGYFVVYIGLVLLMIVMIVESKIAVAQGKKAAAKTAAAAPAAAPAPAAKAVAPGTAGELKLYDTDPKAAAMCMAIVADKLGKPLNELRFISIKEVKNDEV